MPVRMREFCPVTVQKKERPGLKDPGASLFQSKIGLAVIRPVAAEAADAFSLVPEAARLEAAILALVRGRGCKDADTGDGHVPDHDDTGIGDIVVDDADITGGPRRDAADGLRDGEEAVAVRVGAAGRTIRILIERVEGTALDEDPRSAAAAGTLVFEADRVTVLDGDVDVLVLQRRAVRLAPAIQSYDAAIDGRSESVGVKPAVCAIAVVAKNNADAAMMPLVLLKVRIELLLQSPWLAV
jgi:hypothetical protein